MKTQILIMSFLTMGLFACAQTPPKQVTNAFQAKFQQVKKVTWNQEEATEWEAEFHMNGKEMSASFDPSGKWLETETDISKGDLPEGVKSTLNKQYAGYKIKETVIVESPEFSGYEIEMEKGETNIEVQLNSSGKVVSQKSSSDEDGDND